MTEGMLLTLPRNRRHAPTSPAPPTSALLCELDSIDSSGTPVSDLSSLSSRISPPASRVSPPCLALSSPPGSTEDWMQMVCQYRLPVSASLVGHPIADFTVRSLLLDEPSSCIAACLLLLPLLKLLFLIKCPVVPYCQ